MAWPIECPKFSRLRRPVSRSSVEMTCALTRAEAKIARCRMPVMLGMFGGLLLRASMTAGADSSSRVNSSSSHMAAVWTIC